jgi:hypothetical protein
MTKAWGLLEEVVGSNPASPTVEKAALTREFILGRSRFAVSVIPDNHPGIT